MSRNTKTVMKEAAALKAQLVEQAAAAERARKQADLWKARAVFLEKRAQERGRR